MKALNVGTNAQLSMRTQPGRRATLVTVDQSVFQALTASGHSALVTIASWLTLVSCGTWIVRKNIDWVCGKVDWWRTRRRRWDGPRG